MADDARGALRLEEVPVFVLAGGQGTRLRAVWTGPKALAPVEGRPFLAYLLDDLRESGFRRVILLLGAGAEEIEEAFADRDVVALREPRPLGTGGALRAATPLAADWNLIVNGDSYCRAPWGEFLAAAAGRGDRICVMACRVDDGAPFGSLDLDDSGRVVSFREKAARDTSVGVGTGSCLVNGGAYAVRGSFFQRDLSEEAGPDPLSLENTVLPAAAKDGALSAWITEEPFWDIGTPERLELFRRRIREGGG